MIPTWECFIYYRMLTDTNPYSICANFIEFLIEVTHETLKTASEHAKLASINCTLQGIFVYYAIWPPEYT